MAILGGGVGGAGNPVGGSYTGPAEAAEYVNNRVYAYSGPVAGTNSNTPITMLKYTSGSKVQVVDFQYFDTNDATYQRIVQITLNGGIIIKNTYDGSPENGGHGIFYRVIIPAYTEVEVLSNIVTASAVDMFISMTGRVLPK